jgi:hypothetical protein
MSFQPVSKRTQNKIKKMSRVTAQGYCVAIGIALYSLYLDPSLNATWSVWLLPWRKYPLYFLALAAVVVLSKPSWVDRAINAGVTVHTFIFLEHWTRHEAFSRLVIINLMAILCKNMYRIHLRRGVRGTRSDRKRSDSDGTRSDRNDRKRGD